MEGNQIPKHLECRVKVCYVAVSNKNLGILLHQVKIQVFHDLGTAISSPHTENCLNLRIRKHTVYVLPGTGIPCQIIVEIIHILKTCTQLYPVSHALQQIWTASFSREMKPQCRWLNDQAKELQQHDERG